MTPGKFILVISVIMGVLYGLSLVFIKRSESQSGNPTNTWVARINKTFADYQKIDPARDFQSACLQNGELRMGQGRSQCTIDVLPADRKSRMVRRATFILQPGSSETKIVYTPSEKDKNAVDVRVKKLKVRESLTLVFLENGGRIEITKLNPMKSAVFRIE